MQLPKNYQYRYNEDASDFSAIHYNEAQEIVVLQHKEKGQYWVPNKGTILKTTYVILKPQGFHALVTEAHIGIELLRGRFSNRTHILSSIETDAVKTAIAELIAQEK
jgi:hypothetical protein